MAVMWWIPGIESDVLSSAQQQMRLREIGFSDAADHPRLGLKSEITCAPLPPFVTGPGVSPLAARSCGELKLPKSSVCGAPCRPAGVVSVHCTKRTKGRSSLGRYLS